MPFNSKVSISMIAGFFLVFSLFSISALADVYTINTTLNVTNATPPLPPPPPSGLNETLLGAGQGLAGFLTLTTDPLMAFMLMVGVSIIALMIFYGIVDLMGKSFGSSPVSPEADPKKYPLFTPYHKPKDDN